MVLNALKKVTTYCRSSLLNTTVRFSSLYEPPYLKAAQPKIPIWPTLNIQITGYKYPLLESYQSFIHRIAESFDITVEDGFAFPHKEYRIKRFKKRSTTVDAEYNLRIYERDIQISNVSSVTCPIFIRILEATLPEGVSLHIDKYDPAIQKKRLIPNTELLELKSDLNELMENKEK